MPAKCASIDSAIQKSRHTLRQAMKTGERCLKFTRYEEKNIIYKLNKNHYVETNKIVISQGVLVYLAELSKKKQHRIEYIYLDLCQIRDQGLIALLNGNWELLIHLELSQNKLTAISMSSLVKKEGLNFRHLLLGQNHIDQRACAILVEGKWPLEELNLNFNSIGDNGLEKLARNSWKKMKELHLVNNEIGNRGLIGLVKMDFPSLQKLNLGTNRITDDGCKVLAKGKWRQLKSLDLQGNSIQDDGLNHLTKLGSYNLSSLSIFSARTDTLTIEGEKTRIPTMAGLVSLQKGCWHHLCIDVSLLRFGPSSKLKLTIDSQLKDMMSLGNVLIKSIKSNK